MPSIDAADRQCGAARSEMCPSPANMPNVASSATQPAPGANEKNTADLIFGGIRCLIAQSPVESSFLIAAGQTRALADFSVMTPATRDDLVAQTALYGFIFYYAGGAGRDEVFRNPANRDQLFALLDAWQPRLSFGRKADMPVNSSDLRNLLCCATYNGSRSIGQVLMGTYASQMTSYRYLAVQGEECLVESKQRLYGDFVVYED